MAFAVLNGKHRLYGKIRSSEIEVLVIKSGSPTQKHVESPIISQYDTESSLHFTKNKSQTCATMLSDQLPSKERHLASCLPSTSALSV